MKPDLLGWVRGRLDRRELSTSTGYFNSYVCFARHMCALRVSERPGFFGHPERFARKAGRIPPYARRRANAVTVTIRRPRAKLNPGAETVVDLEGRRLRLGRIRVVHYPRVGTSARS
jgi:hypothetical protein